MFVPDAQILQRATNADGTAELNFQCPQCGKDNLWWNPEANVGHCFSCPEGEGNFSEWGMKQLFRDRSLYELENLSRNPDAPHTPRPRTRAELDDIALWYLKDQRHCDMTYLERWGLTPWYEPETDRVCFGLRHVLGKDTDAYMSRPTDPDNKSWKICPPGADKEYLWYDHTIDSPYIVLVEGVFDVLTPKLHSRAIALLGTSLSEAMEDVLTRSGRQIYIWMDPDAAGRRAARRIKMQLPGSVVIDHSKEPGDCTPSEAREILQYIRKGPSNP